MRGRQEVGSECGALREEQGTLEGHVAALTCTCRKCSLISLGDVNKEEVHNMIKFIKQNKVIYMSDFFSLKSRGSDIKLCINKFIYICLVGFN